MKKRLFLLPILALLFGSNSLHSEEPLGRLITIDILSKQIRLLKNQQLKSITFRFPRRIPVEDQIHRNNYLCRAIKIIHTRGSWHVLLDDTTIFSPFRLHINPAEAITETQCTFAKESRQYPLPLILQCDKNGFSIRIKEKLISYARDSAIAEYGKQPPECNQALLALKQIITARSLHSIKNPAHKNSDFCDLTHCQVYKGKQGWPARLDSKWSINHSMSSSGLFFHSCCGGKTFSSSFFQQDLNVSPVSTGIKDWLFQSSYFLCKTPNEKWSRTLSADELTALLEINENEPIQKIIYETKLARINIETCQNVKSYTPEDFRLRINRKKGWNFIRSNNYTIQTQIKKGIPIFVFDGYGLGHGIGFCQKGALQLARLGFNTIEILEHYYPNLAFKATINNEKTITPYLSYCLFDLETGDIIYSPYPQIKNRKIPAGSLFKLFVALYIAQEQPEIITGYKYFCAEKNITDNKMPEKCHKPAGHGEMTFDKALPLSCNQFFSSLHAKIDKIKFVRFFNETCRSLQIDSRLPEIQEEEHWAKILAGLDFNISFTLNDLIRLLMLFYPDTIENKHIEEVRFQIPLEMRNKIHQILRSTMTTGTGSGKVKTYGSPLNYKPLIKIENATAQKHLNLPNLWGKTSTIVYGSNFPVSYGLFIGGYGRTGIFVILRKGNGHLAAKWAAELMGKRFQK